MPGTDPDILVDLTTASSDFEAQTIRQRLESRGIPAFAATTAGSMLAWDIAAMQPMRVQVRRKDLAAAQQLLEETKDDAGSIDWDAEDLGPPDPDEPAAAGPGTPDWKSRHDDKRTVGQTFIWLGSMPTFGVIAIFVFAIRGIRFLWDKTFGRA